MDRIDKILREKNSICDPENPVTRTNKKAAISYKNVSFKYQTDLVVDDLSLDILYGSTVALLGHSGSG